MFSSGKVVELFYDVVSPYSWLAFEVQNVFFSSFLKVVNCKTVCSRHSHIQVHLNKLECRGKVHLFQ